MCTRRCIVQHMCRKIHEDTRAVEIQVHRAANILLSLPLRSECAQLKDKLEAELRECIPKHSSDAECKEKMDRIQSEARRFHCCCCSVLPVFKIRVI